jgi:hypothetical protein
LIAFFVRIFGVFSSWKPSAGLGLLNFNRGANLPSFLAQLCFILFFFYFSIFGVLMNKDDVDYFGFNLI